MSFVSKVIQSGAVPIHFITGKDLQNRDCYYFVVATHEKIKILSSIKNGQFDIKNYGKIIASGFGRLPSESVKQMLLEEYSFDGDSLL